MTSESHIRKKNDLIMHLKMALQRNKSMRREGDLKKNKEYSEIHWVTTSKGP